ncbi:unnamed protein product [Cylindrotheca closterium]|uniref:Uncharacterized protein n=1 Tax=Cylindrotheca closterium TaxID=2856 RepID=A0AAD2G303_9STRA|nr:unnamed protein product [Cylindrotheca closterium]
MTRSLRRSRRAPKTKSGYNVGDVVQITRNGVVLEGRLAQFLSEGSSPNPRWLVKFDGQPHKDEEMYERLFGKLLASVEDEDDQGDSGSLQSQQKRSKPSLPTRTLAANTKGSEVSSEEGGIGTGDDSREISKAFAKNVTPSVDGSNAESDTSSNVETTRSGRSGRVSAREARSKRRQAKIDVDVDGNVVKEAVPPADGKRGPPIPQGNAKKRQRGETDGGDVVKVKLLTGTLYLYRGPYRRVEFVRRV